MPVLPHPPDAFLHLFRRDVVEVRHTQVRPFADMLLAFASAEAHRHGETRADTLLVSRRLLLSLRQEFPVAARVFGRIRVVSDQFDDMFQCDVCGFQSPVASEQAERCFFHNKRSF